MDPIVVVGAGISGIAAARALQAAGLPVIVLDRGKRIGGRMAVRTTDGRPVDTGASYFTVSEPTFFAVTDDWRSRGLARPWTDTFHVFDAGRLTSKSGPTRWAAPRGLRSLVEDLAEGLDVRRQTVDQVTRGPAVDGAPASAVVLAMPDPQAERLLHPGLSDESRALNDPYEPVLVLTAQWDRRSWPDDVDGVFVQGNATLTWIADDGRRRGDGAPVLVAHSTSELAAQHLNHPEGAAAAMLSALQGVLQIPGPPVSTAVHRWTFAKPAANRHESHYLGESGVGLCGDAWSQKPRVEAAYLSGTALGQVLVDRLA